MGRKQGRGSKKGGTAAKGENMIEGETSGKQKAGGGTLEKVEAELTNIRSSLTGVRLAITCPNTFPGTM